MKHYLPPRKRGFSLVEMLVVISIIGVIAAVAVPNITDFTDSANREKSRRNGQTIYEQYRAAKAAGAPFISTTKEEILDELIGGVTGDLVDTYFSLSLAPSEKAGALAYCSYNPTMKTLKYHPEGGQAGDDSTQWTEWDLWANAFVTDGDAHAYWASQDNSPLYEYRVVVDPDSTFGIRYIIEYREPA